MAKKKNKNINRNRGLSAFLRKPAVQLGIVIFVAFVVYLIASAGGSNSNRLARDVNVDKAYEMYQQSGVFVVDVRTQAEWDEYHAPNATLIPLDQLQSRLSEVPKDKEILVVCRSGNRSQWKSQSGRPRYSARRRLQRDQHDGRIKRMVRQRLPDRRRSIAIKFWETKNSKAQSLEFFVFENRHRASAHARSALAGLKHKTCLRKQKQAQRKKRNWFSVRRFQYWL